MEIKAYQCPERGAALSSCVYETKALRPDEIYLRITHCGICHSDIHLIDNDWEFSNYPLVPGHEIVGIVEEKGALVDSCEIGDRVGIGWQESSCMACEWCLKGEENLCASQEATCVDRFGFVDLSDPDALEKCKNSFDFLLYSLVTGLDLTPYLATLRPKGKVCFSGWAFLLADLA